MTQPGLSFVAAQKPPDLSGAHPAGLTVANRRFCQRSLTVPVQVRGLIALCGVVTQANIAMGDLQDGNHDVDFDGPVASLRCHRQPFDKRGEAVPAQFAPRPPVARHVVQLDTIALPDEPAVAMPG